MISNLLKFLEIIFYFIFFFKQFRFAINLKYGYKKHWHSDYEKKLSKRRLTQRREHQKKMLQNRQACGHTNSDYETDESSAYIKTYFSQMFDEMGQIENPLFGKKSSYCFDEFRVKRELRY